MKKINQKQLREMLLNQKGATFVSIITQTVPDKMRKTNNPYVGRVKRIAERAGMLGANYESAVNRQRNREGIETEFVTEDLFGGMGEYLSPGLARHKGSGQEYLVFYPSSTDEQGNPLVKQDQWLVDDKLITGSELVDLKSFIPEPSKPVKQGTEKKIPWNVIKLENVKQLKYNGEIYVVKS